MKHKTRQAIDLKVGQILQMHQEFQQNASSGILFLLRGRLSDFYNDYEQRIKTAFERKLVLQKEWFVFDGDNIKFEEPAPIVVPPKTLMQKLKFWQKLEKQIVRPKEARKPIMQPGKTYEEFMKIYNAFMEESIFDIKKPKPVDTKKV